MILLDRPFMMTTTEIDEDTGRTIEFHHGAFQIEEQAFDKAKRMAEFLGDGEKVQITRSPTCPVDGKYSWQNDKQFYLHVLFHLTVAHGLKPYVVYRVKWSVVKEIKDALPKEEKYPVEMVSSAIAEALLKMKLKEVVLCEGDMPTGWSH